MPAPKGNSYAAKPESEKVSGKGRIACDIGPLKARAVRAASRRGQKLTAWIREAIEEKLARD